MYSTNIPPKKSTRRRIFRPTRILSENVSWPIGPLARRKDVRTFFFFLEFIETNYSVNLVNFDIFGYVTARNSLTLYLFFINAYVWK